MIACSLNNTIHMSVIYGLIYHVIMHIDQSCLNHAVVSPATFHHYLIETPTNRLC